ncbi:MAG: efflux RND transporter permease subunit [Pseudooceanicola sp.]|nr:efflux RND transporter permease subunit [Pseudooceanicola sp.]
MARAIPTAAGGILSYFTRHRTAANLLLVVLLVLGAVAAPNMRTQFFPDVVINNTTVKVTWEGAGPEDVDNAIVQTLEPLLLVIDGVDATRSVTREGVTRITLDFEPGVDMTRAENDVKSVLDSVTGLPDEAEIFGPYRGAWRDRVTDVVISGPLDIRQLALLTDELVARLFAAGVTRTDIRGVAAPQTVIEVPSANLIRHDVSMTEIAAAIAVHVDGTPAGDVTGANARVRTGTEKRSVADIAGIALRLNPDGSRLTVGDVAQVRVEGADRIRSYFVDGNQAVAVQVSRSEIGDSIAIQQTVQEVAEAMQASLPKGVTIELTRGRAEAITARIDLLLDNGLMGLALVVVLLFLFLNARIALWVAAGIPASMLLALAAMYAAGLTINMISLFGLILTLGIVVDDAIVVGEHADFRARRLGEYPVVAAETAARRMAIPVFASTVTTVIAFFGLTFISGRFGEMIRDIPFTVIAVLSASLLECFLILPNHLSHALAHANRQHWYDWPNRTVNKGFRWVRDRWFAPLVGLVLRARYVVVAGSVALLASQAALVIRGDVQWRFFNSPEQGSVTGNFVMAEGATRADTMAMMREMQRAVDQVAKAHEAATGVNPVAFVMAEIGGNTGNGLTGAEAKDPDQLGGISIELIDADLRPGYSSFAFTAELQEAVRQQPLTELVSFRSWRSGPGGQALDVQFYGADAGVLKAASEDLQAAVARYPEVSAVEDTLAYDKEELVLDLTPQGQAAGFTVDTLGRALRVRLNGIEAATYPDGPRSAAIRVELPEGELTADFLERTLMRTPTGAYVPLADLVTVEQRVGFATVRRENGLRLINVTGDISEDDPARAEEISRALEQEILPKIAQERQVEWEMAGLAEQENQFLSDALVGLILCLTGIYLVLAWVFASWTRPLVVMAVIPFGLVGAIWGHWHWEVPMSMFTVVGLLGMTGIIINDSIVLVSTIDEYARERGLIPSIVDGTTDRLRPVMLTTATTVLGLLPLIYESSQEALFLKPTVITLVYGLGFGMLIVLLVVPAVLAIQQDLTRPLTALRRALRAPGRVRGVVTACLALVLAWMAVTVGWAAATGGLPPALAGLAGAGMGAAFGLFLGGAVAAVLATYAVSGLVLRRG